ncbi:JAB domain-containing protein [Sphingopyxis terrae]|uniref:JAB domain-containing protein n=1 Tax=Sphingopyxis terrae TaxID=33052 RepID=UPI003F7DA913
MASLIEPFAGERATEAAASLIGRFGGLGRALAATPQQLLDALGGDVPLRDAIVGARTLMIAGLRERVTRSVVRTDDRAFIQYLQMILAKAPVECLHVTFLAHDMGYLGDELVARGTIARLGVEIREIFERAFSFGAHAIILAHNHPTGSCEPSARDVEFTRRIAALTNAVDIPLVDHLIVGAERVTSMRARGLL